METAKNKAISQKIWPTFSLKRSLLPIGEYAAREGLSMDIVRECGKLGIVQIRKYKGKTFVVDVPIGPYPYMSEAAEQFARPPDETAEARGAADDETGRTENISESTQTVSAEVLEIVDELTAAADEITRMKSLSGSMQTSDLQGFGITDEQLKLADETEEVKEKPKSTQIIQDNGIQLSPLTAQAGSKRTWQIVAVLSIAFLFATLAAFLWLYMDREIQLERLDRANANIQTAYNSSRQAARQIETLQNKLGSSGAQMERLRNDLENYRAEVKTLRGGLTRAEQNLKTIQERNAKAVERLNRQIQKLSD